MGASAPGSSGSAPGSTLQRVGLLPQACGPPPWGTEGFETQQSHGHILRCCSVTQLCLTLCDPWTAAHQGFLFITNSRSLPKLMSIESVMPSNQLLLYHPLLLLPSIFPSIRVFPNELALCIRWPKYWSFSFSISPSNEYSGLISFRIDWFDLLAVQGTFKNLL